MSHALISRAISPLLVLVLSFLALGWSDPVRAQSYSCTSSSPRACDEGQAYAEAWSHARSVARPGYPVPCVQEFVGSFVGFAVGNACNDSRIGTQTFYWENSCAQRPSAVTPFFPPSGSVRCMSGCESVFRDNGDDTTTYATNGKKCDQKPDCAAQGKNMVWNGMLGVCQPVEPECPPGKVKVGNACSDEKPCPDGMALVNGSCKKKDEECPAGMIRSPLGNCIPGDGQCGSGEARGKDGTCKKDKNGNGKPDEEEGDPDDPTDPGKEKSKDEFSGGDDCKSPPSCSGSPIMCGQARIQWRIDCNTRRNNNISGGHCAQAGMPTCTGEKCNAMEYTQLIMQWRSACAIEKLAAKGGDAPGGINSDKNGNGVADVLEGQGEVNAPGDGKSDVDGSKKWGIRVSTDLIDTSNLFGGGGSCPNPPSITIMGSTVSGSDFPYFCQLAAIMRGLVLIFGAYTALRILLGGNA